MIIDGIGFKMGTVAPRITKNLPAPFRMAVERQRPPLLYPAGRACARDCAAAMRSFVAQRFARIDARRLVRGKNSGQQTDEGEQRDRRAHHRA